MKHMTMSVKGDKLTIEIDLSKEVGISKSGKTIIVANTGGNVDVPEHEGYKLGVNVYKYPEAK